MSIEATGGAGGSFPQMLNEAVKGFGEVGKIVRDIFRDLDDLKARIEKEISLKIKEKLEQDLEKLSKAINSGNLTPEQAKKLMGELVALSANVSQLIDQLSLDISLEAKQGLEEVASKISKMQGRLEI